MTYGHQVQAAGGEPELLRRFAELGYHPASGHCPRPVAGRRCFEEASTHDWSDCICHRHHRALDHARSWYGPGGELVLTSEPYEIDGDQVTAYAADLAALGLRLTLSGASPWFPGRTVLLTVTPRAERTRNRRSMTHLRQHVDGADRGAWAAHDEHTSPREDRR